MATASLTEKHSDGPRRAARRGQVASSRACQLGVAHCKRHDRLGRQDDSVFVSPRVSRLRVAVRHTRQHGARFQRPHIRFHLY